MKIITLIENTTFSGSLIAEHGLSIYIEDKVKILFDTGQGKNFIDNAKRLDISIDDIDFLVLSHGHYDHTGGISHFCKFNKKAQIFVGKDFFVPKYKNKADFIGINNNILPMQDLKRFNFIESNIEITPYLHLIPAAKIVHDWDTHFENMYIKKDGQDNSFEIDEFGDEISLIILKDDRMNIISGCSHRGIANIIEQAKERVNKPINLLLGGFHTKDWDNEKMQKLINKLKEYEIDKIGCCHCTGLDKYSMLKQAFGDKVFYNSTGNITDL